MTKLAVSLLIATLSCLSSVYADDSTNYKTSVLRKGCGNSDDVWAYMAKTMGEKSIYKHMEPAKGIYTGDRRLTSRAVVIFADSSWVMTYEYWSESQSEETKKLAEIHGIQNLVHGNPQLDISCIVATGFGETYKQALQEVAETLPTEVIQ